MWPNNIGTRFVVAKAIVIALSALVISPSMADDKPAANEAKKPLVLMISEPQCHAWNDPVSAILKQLKGEYGDRVTFDEIDIATLQTPQTKKKARELGVAQMLPDMVNYAPLVVICSANRKVYREYVGPKTKVVYKNMIESLLTHKDAAPANEPGHSTP